MSTRVLAIPVPREIALLSQARAMLAEASTVDEVKSIRDKAEAIRQYAKAQGECLEIQNQACEVKLRSERRAGELLSETVKKGGSPKLQRATLEPLGIDKSQSHRWQRVASLDEQTFEDYITETKDAGRELTTAGALTLAKVAEKKTRTANIVSEAKSESDINALVSAGDKFACIYADPPWQYGNQATRASTDNHYPTMTVEDIAALPVCDLAADDAHLHLWVTNGFLFESKSILDAWGFEFRSTFIWCKPQMGIGNYWRNSHEILLTAIRGDAKRFNDKSLKSWGEFDRGEHSAKPESVRKFIERASPGPRLELFGRGLRDGWTVWGNQISRTMFDTEVA
jgi:N6-adenosine-specific RNA methylase IME4